MSAVLDIDPLIQLTADQARVLEATASRLPAEWNVLVRPDPITKRVLVRVVGDCFG